jgi:precorrin-6B methylase 2
MDIDSTQKQLGNPYQATPRWIFCRMLRRLGIDYSQYTFIDIGSGKGAVLLYASAFPFKRIVGVEYSAQIDAVARRNIERYRAPNMRCRNVQTVYGDALEYPLPREPLVVYLYNPFKVELMSRMMERLEHSLQEAPRSMIVMSCNPVVEVVVDALPWLERLEKGVNHAIYHNRLIHSA